MKMENVIYYIKIIALNIVEVWKILQGLFALQRGNHFFL